MLTVFDTLDCELLLVGGIFGSVHIGQYLSDSQGLLLLVILNMQDSPNPVVYTHRAWFWDFCCLTNTCSFQLRPMFCSYADDTQVYVALHIAPNHCSLRSCSEENSVKYITYLNLSFCAHFKAATKSAFNKSNHDTKISLSDKIYTSYTQKPFFFSKNNCVLKYQFILVVLLQTMPVIVNTRMQLVCRCVRLSCFTTCY